MKDYLSLLFMKFRNDIYEYYGKESRSFPWRSTSDPYRILISEIMLQQTQTFRVMGKYERFLEAFPDFSALAQADLASVLTFWQGLGYNRRALNLKKTAEIVMRDFGGRLPDSPEELTTLPGIGHATAGAILAFAFNHPVVFIETNIRRVFIHCFFQDRQDITDREILPLVEGTLDRNNPRQWYYALMDYGAMLKGQIPNPNRRSAHYTRQSRFEGSDRQIRGKILRILVEKGDMIEGSLAEEIDMDTARVHKAIAQLKKEGFLVRKGALIRIAQGMPA